MSGSSAKQFRVEQMLTDRERDEARALVRACVEKAGGVEKLGASLNMFSSQLRRVAEGKAHAGPTLRRKVEAWAIEQGVIP